MMPVYRRMWFVHLKLAYCWAQVLSLELTSLGLLPLPVQWTLVKLNSPSICKSFKMEWRDHFLRALITVAQRNLCLWPLGHFQVTIWWVQLLKVVVMSLSLVIVIPLFKKMWHLMTPKGPEKRVPPLWAVQVLNTALFKQNIGKNQLWEKRMFENVSGCSFSILHLIHWQGTLQKGLSNKPEPCLTTCNWLSCTTLNSSTVCGYISHSSILQDAQAIGKISKMVTMLKIAETFYNHCSIGKHGWI